jgi:hypothetical protein
MLVSTTLLVALAAPAAADLDRAYVHLEAVGPTIEATIIDGPRLPLDKILLIDKDRTSVAASGIRNYEDVAEPIAVALVIAGSEVMIGNASIEDADSPARYPGYLTGLKTGMGVLDFAHGIPANSLGMLITYDDAARIRVPMGPIARLDAAAIGTEKDYYMRLGSDLVGAVELAIAELHQVNAARKVLIVIGDGNDTNNDIGKYRLHELKGRAANHRIETYGVIYKGALSAEGEVISAMIPTVRTVASTDAIAPALLAIRAGITNRYVVTFPGDRLRWDDGLHEMTIELGGRRLEPEAVYLRAPVRTPTDYNPFRSWWFQLSMGLGAVGAIALVMRWRARRARR